MGKKVLSAAHCLMPEEACRRSNLYLSALQQEYPDSISNPSVSWNSGRTKMDFGFTFMTSVKDIPLSGSLEILANEAVLTVNSPWYARISPSVEQTVREKLEYVFGPDFKS